MKQKYLECGKIVGTHGIRGMLRVQPWCDSPNFLCDFKSFYTKPDGSEKLQATEVKAHGNVVLLKAEGVDTIAEAEALRGKVLYIDRESFALEEGRYFVQDIIGCEVFDADSGEKLGELTDVSETGANDVWHIKKQDKEYLIPSIPDVVINVDIDNAKIEIRPLKGIFDDED